MFTSLLKTFLLSLPMSMGGLCNSGNSYVHNAYDRRNVATSINDNDDDYEMNSAMVHNNTNYVFKHSQSPDLFNNLPSYVEDTWFSYLFVFDFYIYDESGETHDYHGLHIYRNGGNYSCYAFPHEIEYQADDVERFFYYRGETQVLTIGNFEDSNFVFDSIFVRSANINNNPDLNDLDFYPGEYQLNNWAVFNYFFKTNLHSFTFVESINYNAPYNSDTRSHFINDSAFLDVSTLYVRKSLYSGYFMSNGSLYHDARIEYQKGQGTYYKIGNSEVQKNTTSGVGYAQYLEYVRASDNLFETPLSRVQVQFNIDSNTSGYYISDDIQWESYGYRTIYFMNDITDSDLVLLNKVNYAGASYTGGNDAGLGNAFFLMSRCFSGFASLFGIMIIPGLSIGILLFLPLIMSMIVLVFKAVKK